MVHKQNINKLLKFIILKIFRKFFQQGKRNIYDKLYNWISSKGNEVI